MLPLKRTVSRKSHKKDGNSKRKRSTVDHKKLEEVRNAKARAAHKEKKPEYSFIFVGNLEPTVTEKKLAKIFQHCGNILRIQIRCSGGRAITKGQAIKAEIRTHRDRQHASIEFSTAGARRRALRLDGTIVHGTPIIVSLSTIDLPEVRDIAYQYVGQARERRGLKNLYKVEPPNNSRVRQPTESSLGSGLPANGERDLRVNKNVLFGFSFNNTII